MSQDVKGLKLPRHGLLSTYTNWGCRCDRCRSAKSSYNRVDMAKKRRVLAKLGYNVTPRPRSAPRLGYSLSDRSRAMEVKRLLPKGTKG